MFNSSLLLLALVASCLSIATTIARPFVLDCCADTYNECTTKCDEDFRKFGHSLVWCKLYCETQEARDAIRKTVNLVQTNVAKVANITTALQQLGHDTVSAEHYLIPYIGLFTSCASLLSALVGIFCCCCRGETAQHTVDFRRPHTVAPSPTTPARRRIREASRILHLYHSSAPQNPAL